MMSVTIPLFEPPNAINDPRFHNMATHCGESWQKTSFLAERISEQELRPLCAETDWDVRNSQRRRRRHPCRDRLVELNFIEQVLNLAKTSIVQRSWRREQRPVLHGWVYDPRTGLLKELAAMPPGSKIDEIYTFEWDEA
jgi:carbonic anhydrase